MHHTRGCVPHPVQALKSMSPIAMALQVAGLAMSSPVRGGSGRLLAQQARTARATAWTLVRLSPPGLLSWLEPPR